MIYLTFSQIKQHFLGNLTKFSRIDIYNFGVIYLAYCKLVKLAQRPPLVRYPQS